MLDDKDRALKAIESALQIACIALRVLPATTGHDEEELRDMIVELGWLQLYVLHEYDKAHTRM